MNTNEKIEISIGNGKKIVVEKNDWNDEFPIEAVAYIQNDEGQILQDICLVRQHYEVKDGKAIVSDDVDVLVWAESDNEDYTNEFVINQVKDEDDD